MKKLFVSSNSVELGTLKSLLEEASIEYTVQNEVTHENLPGAAFYPELWIVHDSDFARAAQIRDSWKSEPRDQGPWQCATCGETLEGQFLSCWNCGGDRRNQSPVTGGLQAEGQNGRAPDVGATATKNAATKRGNWLATVAWVVVGTAGLVIAGVSLLRILNGDYGLEQRRFDRDGYFPRVISTPIAFFFAGVATGSYCLWAAWHSSKKQRKH